MVDFKQGEIKDILPPNLLTQEAYAISFSVGEAMRRLQKFSRSSSLYADIAQVPDAVLDLMALETGTQYYAQDMPREIKEMLVMQTLVWYMRAGTPIVLNEFLGKVLGGGYITEWHQYDGKPYRFKAYVKTLEDAAVPLGYSKEVKRQIAIYKNMRSWLESLVFMLSTWLSIKTAYENRIIFKTDFFARYNRAFLLLDGSWTLDGAYLLNGYKELENTDFYPVDISFKAALEAEVKTDTERLSIGTEATHSGAACSVDMAIRAPVTMMTDSNATSKVAGRVPVSPESASRLTIEKDLWYLDGSFSLDGAKLLDAEIFEYEL